MRSRTRDLPACSILLQLKNPMISLGIEAETLKLAAYCLSGRQGLLPRGRGGKGVNVTRHLAVLRMRKAHSCQNRFAAERLPQQRSELPPAVQSGSCLQLRLSAFKGIRSNLGWPPYRLNYFW
jgi:hypothetical protein